MYEVDYDYNDGGFLDFGFMVDLIKVICFKVMDSEY